MGLLRGMARTAVWAGTATAVSNRVSRRQYNRWSQQGDEAASAQAGYSQAPEQSAPPPPAAAAPAAGGEDRIEQLKSLADLKAQGVLTDQEFATEKARILSS